MDAKTTGIVSYLTWIGWAIAFFAGDKDNAKFHLNQALVLNLAMVVCGIVPIIGWICAIAVLVFMIMGLVAAINGQEKEVPLLGKIKLLK